MFKQPVHSINLAIAVARLQPADDCEVGLEGPALPPSRGSQAFEDEPSDLEEVLRSLQDPEDLPPEEQLQAHPFLGGPPTGKDHPLQAAQGRRLASDVVSGGGVQLPQPVTCIAGCWPFGAARVQASHTLVSLRGASASVVVCTLCGGRTEDIEFHMGDTAFLV